MSLASPPWLLAAIAAAIGLLLFWRRADRSRRAALELFAAPKLLGDLTASVSTRRRSVKRALLVAGVLLAGLALAGPQYGFTWEETQRRGIDVLIALDTSRSMLAQDVAPNRLERAKLAVRDLVDKLGSDRVGLIAFAGSAFLQCPLTLDHAAFLESLDALQPGVIPTPGSDLASALRTAEQALATEQRNVKLLVLFSDGEDLGGGAIEAAKHAAEQGIRVFTVGVGSDTGELIPVPSTSGGTEFLKDPQGQYVKSKLDAETLRQVAELTGGFYEPLGRRGEAVTAIYDRALAPLPKEELASRMRRVPIERFQWPLALALLCLAIEPIVRERVTRGRRSRTTAAALVLVAGLLGVVASAGAASLREAQRLYAAGKYDEALAEYRAAIGDQPAPQLDFNLGAAAYKAGQYGDAAAAFARALGSADAKLQEQGFYNLGNAQFRLGEQSKEAKPQQTMQAWQQAIDAYESALKVDPKDEDARYNRDFVKHALEELQKQQQQQQDQKKDDQSKNDQQNKDQQQQQQQQQQDGEQQQQQQGDQQKQDQQKNEQDQSQQQDGGEPQPTPSPEPQQGKDESGDQQHKEEQQKDQPSQGAPGKPSDQQEQGDSQQASPPRQQPGQMSPDEARDLLDSLKDGEDNLQQLDQNAQQQRRGRPRDQERDW